MLNTSLLNPSNSKVQIKKKKMIESHLQRIEIRLLINFLSIFFAYIL